MRIQRSEKGIYICKRKLLIAFVKNRFRFTKRTSFASREKTSMIAASFHAWLYMLTLKAQQRKSCWNFRGYRCCLWQHAEKASKAKRRICSNLLAWLQMLPLAACGTSFKAERKVNWGLWHPTSNYYSIMLIKASRFKMFECKVCGLKAASGSYVSPKQDLRFPLAGLYLQNGTWWIKPLRFD